MMAGRLSSRRAARSISSNKRRHPPARGGRTLSHRPATVASASDRMVLRLPCLGSRNTDRSGHMASSGSRPLEVAGRYFAVLDQLWPANVVCVAELDAVFAPDEVHSAWQQLCS